MFKTPGVGPISVLREHLTVNTTSFGSNVSDDWVLLSRVDRTPARGGQAGTVAHQHDNVAYATNPVEDSWEQRLAGGANGNAGRTNSDIRGGQMT